ncbi:thioredoxin domain-containing protein [Sphingomonas sp. CGMCC 1.13654]|uniref:Thioredoxin domain-containing protein n=1 Tax=Sphingomonas chungangi TaxID=2683589 RepID=A0A838L1K6_9SPHN|nr:thioredoxin domain-containing protein [Sphingomonas chungangi]MBA2932820.1 thioredoxin domain-containing protein [Sphingomonas chungangi]MVW56442.1 thioredoxin domain-containing protein [Sphingomonas chungangi]
MKTPRFLVPVLAALALAGCKQHADDGTAPAATNTASAAPVAAPPGGWTEQVTRTPDGGFVMGNPNAPVKLIEYGSRSCPHCAHFSKEGEPLLKSQYVATGKVSYEFRDFLIHPMDLAAILVGQCNGPSTFFPILDQMMASQDQMVAKLQTLPPTFQNSLTGSPNDQATKWAEALGYIQFVGQRGVPEAKTRACLADPKATDAITQQMNTAQSQFNVDQTPTFLINGTKSDAYDWATLEPALKAAGA